MSSLLTRFLKYVKFDTQSDESKTSVPTTPGQLLFAQHLKEELRKIGLTDITLDDKAYLMAKLPSNLPPSHPPVPAIGFLAHLDTSSEASGKDVKPRVIQDYDGESIPLSEGIQLSPDDYSVLKSPYLQHKTLIVTDGTTLLGADNKAGIAEIITALAYLADHPDIPHGTVCVGFTPDEEIGRGPTHFDVDQLGAQWAYTVDGGPLGELEFENFNACSVTVTITGRNVHPGSAKGKMVNSMLLSAQYQMMLPGEETPAHTDGREGFYHLMHVDGSITRTVSSYIVRDFETEGLENRKRVMKEAADRINAIAPGSCSLVITDSYTNMRPLIEKHPHTVDIARRAMVACGVPVDVKPIRGGSDGAGLALKGLPCPNIYTGGHNYHCIHEFAVLETMESVVEVILKIIELTKQEFSK
eukprot:gnl/Dysnectes_brevis/3733_a4786_665.p1 GENE.gnl/Dysnectes_brevis/3733_a4786_665~~gnl/Dysnectes_brevis/3733_a4786_665.p1  ORF type:complete len:414 (+),score=114.14 gnl/Dysnectes_brevis/3733_a4786_665:813-2054(+)